MEDMLAIRKDPGFTIVELLIVIVVIGILAAIVTVGYTGISASARDSVRKSDISNLSKATELYYVENGRYPMNGGWCTQISHPTYTAAFQAAIQPYLKQLILDPQYSATYQDYFYRRINDNSYYLYAELESEDLANDGFSGCARIGNTNNEYDYRHPSF